MAERIKLKKLAKTDFRLIAIPGEKVIAPGQVKEIEHEGEIYEVSDYYELTDTDMHPAGFLLLSMGQNVPSAKLWRQYPRSKEIYFFICKLRAK